jgi:hypothetical protein
MAGMGHSMQNKFLHPFMKPTPVYKTSLQLPGLAANKCKKTFTDKQEAQYQEKDRTFEYNI